MKRLVDLLVKCQFVVAIFFLVVFVFAVMAQVATRYVPGFTWLWTEQIANYCFIWSIMMGAAVGVRNKEHFFLSVLTEKLKGGPALADNIFVQFMIGLFAIYLIYYGTILTISFWNWSLTSLPQVKQGIFWMALPACGVTMAIYAFYNIYEIIAEKSDDSDSELREET